MRFAKMKRKEIRGILHGSILGKEVRLGIRQNRVDKRWQKLRLILGKGDEAWLCVSERCSEAKVKEWVFQSPESRRFASRLEEAVYELS